MKKTMITLGILASIAGAVTLFPKEALAYKGDPSVEGPNCTAERHEEMEQAFEKNDYNAWKELMQGRGRVTQVINQENFPRFSQAHQLAEEGKLQEANQIRTELGLGLQNGSGNGNRTGMGMGRWSR